jgi:hypothetical protein
LNTCQEYYPHCQQSIGNGSESVSLPILGMFTGFGTAQHVPDGNGWAIIGQLTMFQNLFSESHLFLLQPK